MKKLILYAAIFMSLNVSAQSRAYYSEMGYAIDEMNKIEELDDFFSAANKFERIAEAEGDQWLPYYYMSYIYTILGFKQEDATEAEEYINTAQENIDKAMKLSPDESELFVLQGFLYQAKIVADPQTGGQIYGPKATEAFQKAIELDENNPRPYYLMGMNLLYTPEAYGGGAQAACRLLMTAKEKFEVYTPASNIHPAWGEEYNRQLLEECSK